MSYRSRPSMHIETELRRLYYTVTYLTSYMYLMEIQDGKV